MCVCVKGSTARERTVGLLGPLLSNDRLNNATAHFPLTLSCRGETALCQRLGVPPFKQLPTSPLKHMHARLATSMEWDSVKNICRPIREKESGEERSEGEITAVNEHHDVIIVIRGLEGFQWWRNSRYVSLRPTAWAPDLPTV